MDRAASVVLQWQLTPFDQLTPAQLYAIMAARQEVFVVEQNCPYLDADGADEHCLHLAAWDGLRTSRPRVAAYARLVPAGIKFEQQSFGRVITTSPYRGSGLGKELIQRSIAGCAEHFGAAPLMIGAQDYLRQFYASFGFVAQGEIFMEDNIPHIHMLRTPS